MEMRELLRQLDLGKSVAEFDDALEYPVKAVFAGHDHYFDSGEHDGIRYFTSGGVGSPVYAEPQKGGFAHYILVSVSPETIGYRVVTPNRSKSPPATTGSSRLPRPA